MHTWVRRGLRTALVTGGLLMLGTGIASADENVNPDQPPSPVDAGVSVPISASHTPAGSGTHRAVRADVATPALPSASAPARPAAARANPLIRRAQPTAQRLGDTRGTLSGTIAAARMATPTRTANTAVTGLGAPRVEPAGWTRDPLRTNSSTRATAPVRTVVDGAGATGDAPLAHRLPSVPQSGRLSGVPVVPTIPGVGLFEGPQAQSAPASRGALPGAPTVPSVRHTVRGVSSRLPVTYGTEAPTSTVPTTQSTTVLKHSPLDSLSGVPSLGGLIGGAAPQTQGEVPTSATRSLDGVPVGPLPGGVRTARALVGTASALPVAHDTEAPTSAVQSLGARSVDAPPNGPRPGGSTVDDVIDSTSAQVPSAQVPSTDAPVTRATGMPSSVVQSLDASHVQVHPTEAPTSTVRGVRAVQDSPLSGSTLRSAPPPSAPLRSAPLRSAPLSSASLRSAPLGSLPGVPDVAPVSNVTRATAVPSPVAGLVRSVATPTSGALPGAPLVRNGVDTLFSQAEPTRLAGAPTSVRPGVDRSPLGTVPLAPGLLGTLHDKAAPALSVAQAAEVPPSVPNAQSLSRTPIGALPGAPDLPSAQGVGDQAGATVPLTQSAVVPVMAVSSSELTASADEGTRSVARSALGSLPRVPKVSDVRPTAESAADTLPGVPQGQAGTARGVQQVTGVPSSVRRSVNESPFGTLPGSPQVPATPTAGGGLEYLMDATTTPTRAAGTGDVPVSDFDTSNLPSAPVRSATDSPTGTMAGVPAVRNATTRSLAAVPVNQMAEMPGTMSRSINDSPFSSLPGGPRVPSVPSAPELAARTSSRPPVSYVTGAPSSAVHATHVFGRPAAQLPGLSDADGIAGVLPVVRDLFPRI
jgi:hypothetical protein